MAVVIVAIEPAGEGDFRALRQERFQIGPALGGDVIAAVDQGRGQGTPVHVAARARVPGLAEMRLEALGGEIAHGLKGIAPLDERDAFGDQGFQFDRADFGSVLFALRPFLRLFVAVEIPAHPRRHAVEKVRGGPEQVFEVGFQPRVGQRRDERVENVGDGGANGVGFRQGAGIGLVGEGAPAVELQFLEHDGGGGSGLKMGLGHDVVSGCRRPRLSRPSRATEKRGPDGSAFSGVPVARAMGWNRSAAEDGHGRCGPVRALLRFARSRKAGRRGSDRGGADRLRRNPINRWRDRGRSRHPRAPVADADARATRRGHWPADRH